MKRIITLSIFILSITSLSFSDPGTTAAILQQTAIQTAEHLKRLQEAIQQVELLKSQVTDTKQILDIAIKNSEGIDGVEFVTEFRNIIIETNQLIKEVKKVINTAGNVGEEWKDVFGSLDGWVENSSSVFENIDVSDKINSSGYLIADSYQNMYEQNKDYVEQFVENSKNVSEKGALKQIALEVAQLIQMENNTMYLMSQMLKGQSVENSNENLKRKEEAINLEQEHQGIRRFMGMVNQESFKM